MKFNLIKKLSLFLVLVLTFSLVYSVTSCSENNEIESKNGVNKNNSIEFGNSLFSPQADGSILKYENNEKAYTIFLNTGINSNKNNNLRTNTSDYRIINPNTNEYIDIVNIVEENEYFKFNVITSTGQQINDLKYYGNDFVSSLDTYTNSENQRLACPPCVAVVGAIVVSIIESVQDSPLEQCQAAMNALNCTGGTNPYMQFDEGWFSTTCNVGCH